jgi:hypothetical protein
MSFRIDDEVHQMHIRLSHMNHYLVDFRNRENENEI